MAVIKADAYGHGAVEVARTLAAAGAAHFAVASIEEGIELRSAGIEGEVVLLCGLESGQTSEAVRHHLTPVVHTVCQLKEWQEQAIRARKKLPYHLEVDSGMNRLGLQASSAERLVQLISEYSAVELEGFATHLASAEDFSDEQTHQQQTCFNELVEGLKAAGITPRYIHRSNSAAIAYRPAMDGTMVRPGLALYGYLSPASGSAPAARIQVRPVLEWKAKIAAVKDVAAGSRLGYYGSHRAEKPMRIGVLSVGYGDGLDRRLSQGGQVLVGGKLCPIAGLISMDLTTIDLTAAPEAMPGQEVMLIGGDLSAQAMADCCGTIVYEVLCGIAKRVPRVYCD